MTTPRFSIQALAFAVLILAADCAILRLAMSVSGSALGLVFALFGSLPMAHALAIILYRLATRPDSRRPFLIGFALAGLAVILASFNLGTTADDRALFNLNQWLNNIADSSPLAHGRLSSKSSAVETLAFMVSYFSVLALLTALPQFLCALLGGWLGRRIAASLQPAIVPETEPAEPPT
jgi:ABC-type antimicrobial peptide transport system permease subunit